MCVNESEKVRPDKFFRAVNWLGLHVRSWISQQRLVRKYDCLVCRTAVHPSFTVPDKASNPTRQRQNVKQKRTALEHHRTRLRVERIFMQFHRARQRRRYPTTQWISQHVVWQKKFVNVTRDRLYSGYHLSVSTGKPSCRKGKCATA